MRQSGSWKRRKSSLQQLFRQFDDRLLSIQFRRPKHHKHIKDIRRQLNHSKWWPLKTSYLIQINLIKLEHTPLPNLFLISYFWDMWVSISVLILKQNDPHSLPFLHKLSADLITLRCLGAFKNITINRSFWLAKEISLM